ncbi:MAG: hypothetical protein K8R89_09590 [Anaerolineae bacterium]|nr:hypothetical protein [Anaerolineae bacterium]
MKNFKLIILINLILSIVLLNAQDRRTIDSKNGVTDYDKIFTEPIVEMSVWKYIYPAEENQPQMTFTITDFRNLLSSPINKRFVFISMIVGPDEKPYWEGIITKGYHTKME